MQASIVYFDQTLGQMTSEASLIADAPPDVLSDVLSSLRATGTVYFCDRLVAPWSKTFDEVEAASFHQVRRGACRVTVGDEVALLNPGDLVFIGPGIPHVLDSEVPGAQTSGNEQAETLLLCGYCRFELQGRAGPSTSLFPSFAILKREQLAERAWLAGVLDQLGVEYLSNAPGATLAVGRLTEVLVLELIRMDFGRDGHGELVRALADPPIATALQALHTHPERAWTLDSLAQLAGVSRAAFAQRFRDRVGQTMFDYLTALRVERAAALLADSTLAIPTIAGKVGYDSDVAFVKMFKRRTGVTPTAWRSGERGDMESVAAS